MAGNPRRPGTETECGQVWTECPAGSSGMLQWHWLVSVRELDRRPRDRLASLLVDELVVFGVDVRPSFDLATTALAPDVVVRR